MVVKLYVIISGASKDNGNTIVDDIPVYALFIKLCDS